MYQLVNINCKMGCVMLSCALVASLFNLFIHYKVVKKINLTQAQNN